MIKHRVQHITSFAIIPNTMRPCEKCCNCAYEYEANTAPDKCRICGCEHSIVFEKEDMDTFWGNEEPLRKSE